MSGLVQLKREKTRAIAMAAFELVLGLTMILISLQFFSASESLRYALYEMESATYTPEYLINLFRAMITGSLAAGFFALVHGAKRVVDNSLNAWVKSALPTESG